MIQLFFLCNLLFFAKASYRCYLYQKDDSCLVDFIDGGLWMRGRTPDLAYAGNPDWGLLTLTMTIPTVVVEKDVTVIPQDFLIGRGVKYVYLEDSVTSINKNAFKGNEIETLRIPKSCKTIGSNSFQSNRKLNKVYIPSNVT